MRPLPTLAGLNSWFGWGAEQVAPDRFRISLDEETFMFVPDDLLEFKYEVIPTSVADESGVSSRTRLKRWLGRILGSRGNVAAALALAVVGLALGSRSPQREDHQTGTP